MALRLFCTFFHKVSPLAKKCFTAVPRATQVNLAYITDATNTVRFVSSSLLSVIFLLPLTVPFDCVTLSLGDNEYFCLRDHVLGDGSKRIQ